ncbi:MAG: hypothetical protein ACLFTF_03365 [Desulfonatronovibrio sp.]
MFFKNIMTLGLGLEKPWKIVEQWLETNKSPHELFHAPRDLSKKKPFLPVLRGTQFK